MQVYFNGVKLTNANVTITTTIEYGDCIDITDNNADAASLHDAMNKITSGEMVLIDKSSANKIKQLKEENERVKKRIKQLEEENECFKKVEELTRENETLKCNAKLYKINAMTRDARIAELKTVNAVLQDIINTMRGNSYDDSE